SLTEIENRTENPCVAGSIPADTTKIQKGHFHSKMAFLIAFEEFLDQNTKLSVFLNESVKMKSLSVNFR
ncbi:hypothetical protein, partial [Mucilaginibacter sp.]|uniref:hypothetical protein n=1 Tax=Mucilaginibacter sp. TaxID=1882438 RepID=UPI00284119CE